MLALAEWGFVLFTAVGMAYGFLAIIAEAITRPVLHAAGAATTTNLRHAEAAFRNSEVIVGMGMGDALAARWYHDNTRGLDLHDKGSARLALLSAISKASRQLFQILMGGGNDAHIHFNWSVATDTIKFAIR